MNIRPIAKKLFDAYEPMVSPEADLLFEQIAWYEGDVPRTLGVLIRDRTDGDFGWVVLRRYTGVDVATGKQRNAMRAWDMNVSVAAIADAVAQLHEAMKAP